MKARGGPAAVRDAGTSLIEVLVAMGIMSLVGGLFTSAILQVYRASNDVEAMTQAQTQVRLALQRLDREIRYAYGITTPSTVTEAGANPGTWNVEFLRIDAASGVAQCKQLRLKDGLLRLRQWAPGAPPSAAEAGTVLASELDMSIYATASTGDQLVPFELQAPSSGSTAATGLSPDFQRLRVRLRVEVGAEPMSADTTFVALNAPRTTESTATSAGSRANACRQEGRP